MESKGKFILGIIVLAVGFVLLAVCSMDAVHDTIWSSIKGN